MRVVLGDNDTGEIAYVDIYSTFEAHVKKNKLFDPHRFKIITSDVTLSEFFDLYRETDTPEEVDEWLDDYLLYRKACEQLGWAENEGSVYKTPDDWKVSKTDYLHFPDKITQVFKPLCTDFDAWVKSIRHMPRCCIAD